MKQCSYDVAVIGGGPAGLAAAIGAKKEGAGRVAVFERDFRAGGILEQCIHPGFGLKRFKEELSGPEYAARFIAEAKRIGVEIHPSTTILSLDGDTRKLSAVNPDGNLSIEAGAVVLAMGCRERTRHQLAIPGTRPAGVFNAGAAQRYINVQNYRVGQEVVILGSGDIGMIMARRLSLDGAHVKAVIEIMPYLAGLTRNKVQCLDDFDIPLYLSHTITRIGGTGRVSCVDVCRVDAKMAPIPDTKFTIECDTVLCSVGLIPENELSRAAGVALDPVTGGPVVDSTLMTNRAGIFACGNVLHVNDLVDNVSLESELAGRSAARFVKGVRQSSRICTVTAGNGVRYTMPRKINLQPGDEEIEIFFRVLKPMRSVALTAKAGDAVLVQAKRVRANPGEMESLQIPAKQLEGVDEVVISAAAAD